MELKPDKTDSQNESPKDENVQENIEIIESELLESPESEAIESSERDTLENPEGDQLDAPEQEKSVDESWAESLGLKYDAEEIARRTPPTVPATPPPFIPAPPAPMSRTEADGHRPVSAWQESEPMPATYMLWSILSVVFCCFIPGIVAIVYSAQVSSKYYAKDYEGARRASERAQGWIIASIVLGVISAAFYLPLTLMGS